MARPLRGDERVEPQIAELLQGLGRIVAQIHGHLLEHGSKVLDGILDYETVRGWSELWAVARPANISWWALSTTAWHLYTCPNFLPFAIGMMRDSRSVKLRWEFVAVCLDSCPIPPRLALQSFLPDRQIRWPLISALGRTVLVVFRRPHLFRLPQDCGYLLLQLHSILLHAPITHGLGFGGVGLHFFAF